MIAQLIRVTLVGIIILAIAGFVGEVFGPEALIVLVGGEVAGTFAYLAIDARRTSRANRDLARLMGKHAAMGFRPPPPPDSLAHRPVGFCPTNIGYQAVERPVAPSNRLVREGAQPRRR